MAVVPPVVVPAVVDDFDTVFAELAKESAPQGEMVEPKKVPPVEAQAAPVVEPVTEIEGAPAPEAKTEEPKAEGEPQGEPKVEEPQAKTPNNDDAVARLSELLAQRDAEQRAAQMRAYQAQNQGQGQQQTPLFNAEDQAFLSQYIKDFPDVARAEAMVRQVEYRGLVEHIFREVTGYFAPKIALLEQLADTTAYGELAQRVPDYDTTRDKVVAWANSQPAYLRAAYNHVIQAGTVEEISDLFDRYAQSTGATSPQPSPGIAPQAQAGRQVSQPAARPAAELSPAAKQAAARLAPVTSKRSAPTQGAPLTFEDAFDAFAKETAA